MDDFRRLAEKVYKHTWKYIIMKVLFYFTIAQEGGDSEQTEEDNSDESSHSGNEVSERDNQKICDHIYGWFSQSFSQNQYSSLLL